MLKSDFFLPRKRDKKTVMNSEVSETHSSIKVATKLYLISQ